MRTPRMNAILYTQSGIGILCDIPLFAVPIVLNVLTVRGRAGGEAEGRRRSMVEGSGHTIGLS